MESRYVSRVRLRSSDPNKRDYSSERRQGGRAIYVSKLIAFLMASGVLLVSCSPLDPLGGEDLSPSADRGTTVGQPTSLIKSTTWNLSNVSRVQVPFGEIDPIYLDGKVPESVNFEMEGSTITRHRVLDWGQLQLKDNGFFRFILQYSRYAVKPGEDVGPTAVCNADIRGLYSVRDGTILLYPERFPTDNIMLQLDATGSLRSIEMPTTCSGNESGVAFESTILLKDLVMNPVRS